MRSALTRRLVYSALSVLVLALPHTSRAQPGTRRVTTVTAIHTFPGFYHSQPVLLRGEIKDIETHPAISSGDETLRLLTRDHLPTGNGAYDVRGEVLDIGRLEQNDPRLSGVDLHQFGVDSTDRWPRQGEVVVLRATSFEPAEPLTAPSVRTLALDPLRYADQKVTVTGQFRGRNLFGDLPQAPPTSMGKGEFVIKSADAALWVLRKPPKGRGWVMNPDSRIDTRRWLEVTGVVKSARGLVWIEADTLNEVPAQKEKVTTEAPAPPPPPIPPEILFSAPTQDETDVPLHTRVRVQFSRDIDPETLKGHIRVGYSAQQSSERGEPQPPRIEPILTYDPAARVLNIQFATPLERFRIVIVELAEGITGTDGAPLKPWTLSFTLGGS
jgi:hypothetical protein